MRIEINNPASRICFCCSSFWLFFFPKKTHRFWGHYKTDANPNNIVHLYYGLGRMALLIVYQHPKEPSFKIIYEVAKKPFLKIFWSQEP